MDSLKKTVVCLGLAVCLTGGRAQAADMQDTFLEPLIPVEIASQWYLRGDIAYRFNTTPSIALTGPVSAIYNQSLDDSWGVGMGAGYRFNPWFRFDLTADYSWPSDMSYGFTGLIPHRVLTPYNLVAGSASNVSEISAWTLLANAYVDLGTWNGITPYVGAGIGAAYLMMGDSASVYSPLLFTSYRWVDPGDNKWNVAWALMAGTSFDITSNWVLDVGYRYLNLGKVSSYTRVGTIEASDIASHEVRVGMRFLID
jgi:opacity protein-like surface antigen